MKVAGKPLGKTKKKKKIPLIPGSTVEVGAEEADDDEFVDMVTDDGDEEDGAEESAPKNKVLSDPQKPPQKEIDEHMKSHAILAVGASSV